MTQSVISDNWSLQDISDLLVNGMEDSSAHYIDVDTGSDTYSYKNVSAALIKTQALFDLITDIILRDQIIVEDRFIGAWARSASPLDQAQKEGIIRSYPFLLDYKKLVHPRNELTGRLCVTSGLKKDHEENIAGWKQTRHSPHALLAQVLWGGAGMLARGFVYEKGYTPHPVRRKFLVDTGIALHRDDAVQELTNVITEEKARVSAANRNSDELYSLKLSMPPLPLMVVREAKSAKDLITVAIELRKEYQDLRDWLGQYQLAMTDGTYKDAEKFQKIIRSISQYIGSKMENVDSGAPTFSLGIGVLKMAVKGRPVNSLRNQFGVRSMINKLILNRAREADLRRFLSLFDQRNTAIGMKVIEGFVRK